MYTYAQKCTEFISPFVSQLYLFRGWGFPADMVTGLGGMVTGLCPCS